MRGWNQESGIRNQVKDKGLGVFHCNLKPDARNLAKGFTLLEVMIALAVIATALVALLGLSNRSIEVNGRLQKITQATLLAQQRISEIEVQAAQPGFEFREDGGDFEAPFETFRWTIAYEDTPLPYLQIVRVSVFWGDPLKNENVDLASFIFRQGQT